MVQRNNTTVRLECFFLALERMSNWVDTLGIEKHIDKVDGIK
jgi:hypothetical protein